MALSILTNPVAIGTQGSVNNANNALAKTIKQLSSGLRINSAADDASGLAVSEKLRGQISGLKVASRNAQDGISFLQTAEAAMGTMTSMVQRVRELAVQAGDPAYTDGDRVMLQTEVDQLKEEINRVSSSAEFNTKKLLNGDSAALWSATGGIDAIVRGATVEGNYNIASTLTPGTNNIYKTQAMNIANGKQSFDMTTAGGGITRLDNITGTLAGQAVAIVAASSAALTTALAGGVSVTQRSTTITTATISANFSAGQAGAIEMRFLSNGILSSAGTIQNAVEVRVTNLVTGKQSEWVSLNASKSGSGTVISLKGTAAAKSALFTSVGLNASGAEWSANTTLTVSAGYGGAVGEGFNKAVRSGNMSGLSSTASTAIFTTNTGMFGAINNIGGTATDKYGAYTVEIEALSSDRIKYRAMNSATGALSSWYEVDIVRSAGNTGRVASGTGNEALSSIGIGAGNIFTTANSTFSVALRTGDKALIAVNGQQLLTAGTSVASAGYLSANNGPKVLYTGLVNGARENSVRLFSAQMDSAGKAYYGSMDALMAQNTRVQSGSATVQYLNSGDAAATSTRLSDLANFINADGVNVLDNTQTLTIYGNGRQTNITLDKSDTIKTFEDKMRAAIVDGLGMGSEAAADVNNNLVKFVGGRDVSQGDRAVPGTFIFQGAKLGSDSEISFSGNQNVINALGVANIQQATISQLQVNVTNAHNGTFVGSTTTSDGIARGLIQNVDLKLDMAAGADASWDATSNKLVFTPNAGTESFLHLKNNATVAAIGANEGQTLDISIGRMDTTSLGIDDVSVLTLGAAQKSITKLDLALDEINKSRAVVGAQMNRLDYTINNLNVTRENMMSAESRIRDLDMAEAATNLTAQQVRLQAATAMLAQANQLPTYAAQLLR